MVTLVCKQCGVTFSPKARGTKGRATRFCSRTCIGIANRGSAHYHFKGGRNPTSNDGGYVSVLAHDHPRAYNNRVYEHILVAEKALGRLMPEGAEVHHVDGNGRNNTPSNLVICQDHAYHFLLEVRARRLRDTGSLDLKRCKTCGEVKPLDMFYNYNPSGRRQWDGKSKTCKPCEAVRVKAYRTAILQQQAAISI